MKNKERLLKKIGVLGGLGSYASAHFYKTVLDYCTKELGATLDADFPYIVLFNIASSGLSESGRINEMILLTDINKALDDLSKIGVDFVAIACNSIFTYYQTLTTQTNITILNLPHIVASNLHSHSIKSVSILGSRGVTDSKLFDDYFFSKSIKPVYPDISIQKRIDSLIASVIRGNHNNEISVSFKDIIQKELTHSDAVLIACSELSTLVNPFSLPDRVFDSMHMLAQHALFYATS